MEILRLKNWVDQYFILRGGNSRCFFPTPNTEDRGGAEQTKQDNKMMMFRKGLSKTFPFSVNAFPAFRLTRKLFLVVDGILLIAPRVATVLHCSTIHPTPAHLLNGEGWRGE